MPKYRQLPELSNPHYALFTPPLLLHMVRVLAWGATAAFFIWGVPNLLERVQDLWLIWVTGGILLLVSIGLAMPASFRTQVNFACDMNGVYIVYERDKHAFIPWNRVRDIRIETISGSGSRLLTGLVVEAKIDDPELQTQLFRTHFLFGKDPIDEDGYGRAGISNNARSMTKAVYEINRIRRLAGLMPFE